LPLVEGRRPAMWFRVRVHRDTLPDGRLPWYLSGEVVGENSGIQVVEIPWVSPARLYGVLRKPHSLLLESVQGPWDTSRYSLVCDNPTGVLKGKDGAFCFQGDGGERSFGGDLIAAMRGCMPKEAVAPGPFFSGGLVGFLSYDSARYFEKLPHMAEDDLHIDDVTLFAVDSYILFDHLKRQVLCCSRPDSREPAARLAERVREALDRRPLLGVLSGAVRFGAFSSNFGDASFRRAVEEAKEYIFAGDIYQVNISQRLSAPIEGDPFSVYLALRSINPSPFSAYMDLGGLCIAGCSPERLVRLRGSSVQTRPIAGTYRRGTSVAEDEALRRRLLADAKEKAEHIMLVDLERNDIGRACRYGSVRVDELMVTESYSHVNHIVSNVKGALRPGLDQFDLLAACFPGGTITGCPKVRAMEVIEELEPVRRGIYTGSMGYFGYDGNMDLNIVIRSMLVKEGHAYVQAGAGIVADSVPEREYRETLRKAQALLEAAEMAGDKVHRESIR